MWFLACLLFMSQALYEPSVLHTTRELYNTYNLCENIFLIHLFNIMITALIKKQFRLTCYSN